jgi:hypothetical protein
MKLLSKKKGDELVATACQPRTVSVAQEARVDVFDEEEGSKCLEGTLGEGRRT